MVAQTIAARVVAVVGLVVAVSVAVVGAVGIVVADAVVAVVVAALLVELVAVPFAGHGRIAVELGRCSFGPEVAEVVESLLGLEHLGGACSESVVARSSG